jgi:peptidoglycan hydrolase-like protein with peptidoglycan-binding domain
MDTLKSLMAKVADLQKQLAATKGEIKDANAEVKVALKAGLKEGMTDEDIKEIQELLASDKDIYPEGMVTGYFGKLTKEAVKRFQTKHGITASGEIDTDTKDLLEEYLGERFDGKVPQGLLRAPGIMKKVQDKMCEGSRIVAWGLFCKDHQKPDVDEDEDEDEDTDTDEFEVEVEIEDGATTVSFTFDGDDYTVEVDSTTQGRVLTEVAEELDTTVRKLDADLVVEIKAALAVAVAADDDVTEDEAEDAVDAAQDSIDDVQEDIDNADEDVDVDEAQDALDDAQELLDDAQDALDDEDFEEADDLAEDAEDAADEAAELLEEAIEDAE